MWNQHTRIIVEHRTGSEFANACLVSRISEKSKASEKYAQGGRSYGKLVGSKSPQGKKASVYIYEGEENSRKQERKSHMKNRTQTKVTT